MALVTVKNLSFRYAGAKDFALKNVDLDIREGDFIVLCGQSGCGKSTLLKMIKRELSPTGEKTGEIFYNGILQEMLSDKVSALEIGFVMQNPENQIITDKVWHELAFGLESMGIESAEIKRRCAEMAGFFGIGEWYRKKTSELSGGQKQILNLASVMVMQPKILLLDEPTAQLDPIAARNFLELLKRLNRDFNLTILLVEHRLEEVFSFADKVVILDSGKILVQDSPKKAAEALRNVQIDHPMIKGFPVALRVFYGLTKEECPLTVKEGAKFLKEHFNNKIKSLNKKHLSPLHKIAEINDISFRYQKNDEDVLNSLNLTVKLGEILSIVGSNGSGKTTLLNIIAGLTKPYRGSVRFLGKDIKDYKGGELYRNNLSLLPQNPEIVFLKSTVQEDFTEVLSGGSCTEEQAEQIQNKIVDLLNIGHLLFKHPYDLSGGEQQKCALAKLLLLCPKLLLLDEPTKGIDAYSKHVLAGILKDLQNEGITILLVTHDLEFAAEVSNRCCMLFDGEILSETTPENFFQNNHFYTTPASRMSRGYFENAVTAEDVIKLCKLNERKEEQK